MLYMNSIYRFIGDFTMKMNETSLRKIIREEIGKLSEIAPVDPAAAAAVAGAFSPDQNALNVLYALVAASGITVAAIPGVQKAMKMLGGKTATDKKVSESIKRFLMKESVVDSVTAQMILQAVAAMATAGVGATVLTDYLSDVAKKMGIKPDAEQQFFGSKLD